MKDEHDEKARENYIDVEKAKMKVPDAHACA